MGKRLVTKSGNDSIYTPNALSHAIVKHYNPQGMCLEPCKGNGAFIEAFDAFNLNYDWAEISCGRDFFYI